MRRTIGLRGSPSYGACAYAGETQDEALVNIREAIELYLEPPN